MTWIASQTMPVNRLMDGQTHKGGTWRGGDGLWWAQAANVLTPALGPFQDEPQAREALMASLRGQKVRR